MKHTQASEAGCQIQKVKTTPPPTSRSLYRIFKKWHSARNSYMTEYITVYFGGPKISGISHQQLTHGPLQVCRQLSFTWLIPGVHISTMLSKHKCPLFCPLGRRGGRLEDPWLKDHPPQHVLHNPIPFCLHVSGVSELWQPLEQWFSTFLTNVVTP